MVALDLPKEESRRKGQHLLLQRGRNEENECAEDTSQHLPTQSDKREDARNKESLCGDLSYCVGPILWPDPRKTQRYQNKLLSFHGGRAWLT